jgi:hypothetical protein
MFGLAALGCVCLTPRAVQAEQFIAPSSPTPDFNFNPGWKFHKGDVTDGAQSSFDDSKWADVAARTRTTTLTLIPTLSVTVAGTGTPIPALRGIESIFEYRPDAKDGKVFSNLRDEAGPAGFGVNGKFVGKYEKRRYTRWARHHWRCQFRRRGKR